MIATLVVLAANPVAGLMLRMWFVLASAPLIGGVLLLAIARLTGASWAPTPAVLASKAKPANVRHPREGGDPSHSALGATVWRWVPAFAGMTSMGEGRLIWLAPVGALAMLGATGVPLPPHLSIWSQPIFVAGRALAFIAALAFVEVRLAAGASVTFAGVTLALYAWAVTPIAADWLLPTAPSHPVSAVGMMLFLLHFSAGCALGLLDAEGRARRDLAMLLVAALLGLSYLCFMDYLIVWYGNLPDRIGFYMVRNGWVALATLAVGLGGTGAAVIMERYREASLPAAAGLVLFSAWWIGGPLGPALIVILSSLLLIGLVMLVARHG